MRANRPKKAIREADAAECLLWSEQMEGFGGPAQPSPTIAQCLNGGYGWLEVMCHRCETRASLPLDAIRRPRDTPIWKLEAALKCRACADAPVRAAGAHDQAHQRAARLRPTPGFIPTMIDEIARGEPANTDADRQSLQRRRSRKCGNPPSKSGGWRHD